MVQQARTAVEADRVRWELTNGITTGGGAATEVGCTLTVSELNARHYCYETKTSHIPTFLRIKGKKSSKILICKHILL